MSEKVWFVTGAGRGLGRIWTEAALKRGDKVAATARKREDVVDLQTTYGANALALALDVTNAEDVQSAVRSAYEHFGRLDVVLNNAGGALIATIEEATDEEIHALFEANYFGMVRVLQAALPYLRQQRSGHLLGVSSAIGVMPAPLIGFYAATKAAVEATHESMAREVEQFGIKVTIVEPGAYATDFGATAKRTAGLEAYADLREQIASRLSNEQRGDPQAASDILLTLVDAEHPPLRLAVGSTLLPRVRQIYADRLAVWETWRDISNAAQGESRKGAEPPAEQTGE